MWQRWRVCGFEECGRGGPLGLFGFCRSGLDFAAALGVFGIFFDFPCLWEDDGRAEAAGIDAEPEADAKAESRPS